MDIEQKESKSRELLAVDSETRGVGSSCPSTLCTREGLTGSLMRNALCIWRNPLELFGTAPHKLYIYIEKVGYGKNTNYRYKIMTKAVDLFNIAPSKVCFGG